MAPATPPGNGSTPPGNTGAAPWTLPIPPDPRWEPRRLEIPEAFRRPPLQLLPTPPARDWSILHQYYPQPQLDRLRECRWDWWHRRNVDPLNDPADEMLPNGCGDRVRCGWCGYSYARSQADEEFEIIWLVFTATGAQVLTIELELPSTALSLWAPNAAARGCLHARGRGGLCRRTCVSCAAAHTLWAVARRIEDSFVKCVLGATRRLLPGTGGVRVSICADGRQPFIPRYSATLHIPLIALAATDEARLISPPDMNSFAANLNKRTGPAGLGQVTGLTATISSASRDIANTIWSSNVPLLAHAVREIRNGHVAIPDEVHATVARLTLPGPSGRRHRRRSWFGSLSNGAQREQALRAMRIYPIPDEPGATKKIVDKVRPFSRSALGINVQSLWTGDETVVPSAWFQREPLLNRRGFVIARVPHAKWEYRRP
jgi:hypothetical protein